MMSLQTPSNKFLIVSIIPHNLSQQESYQNIKEVIDLIESYGGIVVDIVLQNREVHDKGRYIGQGKAEEVSQLIKEKQIDVVVLNGIVVPGQIFALNTLWYKSNPQIQIWDRVDLILKIFAQHAFTAESKLQIELAAMRHMGPRIFGMGLEMSQQGGGIGTRGIGETNTELMRRHWKNEIKNTQDKLKKLTLQRQQQLNRRKELGFKTVSIIGYTNAGKTSLFNVLTKKKKLAKNILFATLESYTGKIYLRDLKQEVLISDTIGFIRDLPPQLIDAFKSTLMESINADLLIHVIDLSDPDVERKIEVVEKTLQDLGINTKKIIYLFNKIDLAKKTQLKLAQEKYHQHPHHFVSVQQNKGIEELLVVIAKQLA